MGLQRVPFAFSSFSLSHPEMLHKNSKETLNTNWFQPEYEVHECVSYVALMTSPNPSYWRGLNGVYVKVLSARKTLEIRFK